MALRVVLLIGAFWAATGTAAAQQPFYYPAKGQSQELQVRDLAECRIWGTQQTGFDPANPPPAPQGYTPSQQTAQGPDGSRVVGAARGAAIGAVVGEIADDDAGKGAAAGAAAGAIMGGMKRRQRRRQQQAQQNQAAQQQQQAVQAYEQQLAELRTNFNRATGACMTSRGYTVS